jgi:hypothetical protein
MENASTPPKCMVKGRSCASPSEEPQDTNQAVKRANRAGNMKAGLEIQSVVDAGHYQNGSGEVPNTIHHANRSNDSHCSTCMSPESRSSGPFESATAGTALTHGKQG